MSIRELGEYNFRDEEVDDKAINFGGYDFRDEDVEEKEDN